MGNFNFQKVCIPSGYQRSRVPHCGILSSNQALETSEGKEVQPFHADFLRRSDQLNLDAVKSRKVKEVYND